MNFINLNFIFAYSLVRVINKPNFLQVKKLELVEFSSLIYIFQNVINKYFIHNSETNSLDIVEN